MSTSREKPKISKKIENKFLYRIADDSTSLRGRIAILCFPPDDDSSHIIDRIVLSIEYAQCIALAFISSYKVHGLEKTSERISISNVALILFKMLNPITLIQFQKETRNLVFTLMVLMTLKFILSIALFAYIAFHAAKKSPTNQRILLVWRWFFKLQGRVFFYPVATLWMLIAEALLKNKLALGQHLSYFLATPCFIMFILELFFSLFLQTQFTGVLPYKSLLSCKDNKIETITLLQKALCLFIRRLSLFYPQVSLWINCITEVLLSAIRCKYHFTSLNPYNLDSLYYQAHFLVAILSMNIVCLMQIPLHEVVADMNFVLIAWIILTIFTIKISNNYLKSRVLKLMLLQHDNLSPRVLIHKIIATNYLLKKASAPISCSEKCDLTHLVRNTLQERIQGSDLTNKQARREFFRTYLENLSKIYPKNEFLKLYTAYFYAKKLKIYGLCLRLLTELRHSSSWKIDVSASILYNNIINKIIQNYKHQVFALDLNEYIKNKILISKTRMRIIEQANLQIKICEEILEPQPNYASLQNFGQKVSQIKNEIERTSVPDYNLELLLIYTYYYLIVNHSYEEYQHYSDLYFKRIQRREKSQDPNVFCQENLYRNDVGLLVYSGSRENSGKILFCGGNYQEIFGKNLTGEHLRVISTPILRPNINQFLKGLLEKGVSPFLDLKIPRFLYNVKGYMTQVNWYTNINPYSSQGVTYCVIYKTLHTNKEFLLINEDGGVECFTKNIAEKLNLFALKNGEERNIGFVCPDLERVVHAFNMIAHPERKIRKLVTRSEKFTPMESSQETPHFKKKSSKSIAYREQIILSQEEAQALYKLYSEGEGKILIFERYDRKSHNPKSYAFRCTMRNIIAGDKIPVTKEITLERIKGELPQRHLSQEPETIHIGSYNKVRKQVAYDEDSSPKSNFDFEELRTKNQDLSAFTCQTSSNQIQSLASRRDSSSSRLLLMPKFEEKSGNFLEDYRRISTSDHVKIEGLLQVESEKSEVSSKANANKPVLSLETGWLTVNKRKSAKAMKQLVNTPYNPAIYKISRILIILAIVLLFGLQTYLEVRVHSTLEDLNINKQVLRASQMRNKYLIDIHGSLSFFLCYALNLFSLEQVVSDLNVATLANHTKDILENLKRVNLELLEAGNSFDAQAREIIFRKDVKVYETYFNSQEQIYVNLTNFQATNEIIEGSLKALSAIEINPRSSIPSLKFVLRNVMNDPLTKDILIADTFFASLQKKTEETISNLYLNFSFSGALLLMMTIQILFVIISQYHQTSKNMLALTKLNNLAIQNIIVTLRNFQDLLKRNASIKEGLEDKVLQEISGYHMKSSSFQAVKSKYEQKAVKSHNGLKKEHILLSLLLGGVISMAIGLLLTYLMVMAKKILDLNHHAGEIYFIEKMDSNLALARNSLFDMGLSNNTALVQGEIASVVFEREMKKIQEMKDQIYDRFSGDGDVQDKDVIQPILFSDACQFFEQSEIYYNLCKNFGHNLEKTSFINMITNVQTLFEQFYLDFMSSNRTIGYLINFQINAFQKLIAPLYSIIQPLDSILSNALNENFMAHLSQSESLNKKLFIGTILILVFAYYVIKIMIISRLGRKENEFRKMLLLFPANVVLSNFMLKSYLARTSQSSSFDLILYLKNFE